MAAGMGSRYSGLKQLAEIGPNGETLMEYSMYDAYRAGFRHILIVVRGEILLILQNKFAYLRSYGIEINFIIQEIDIPQQKNSSLQQRKKPWGSGHAIYCCLPYIDSPFVVINADDYYGKDAFFLVSAALEKNESIESVLIAYYLKNTLSSFGKVSRGICKINHGYLKNIQEKTDIFYKDSIIYTDNNLIQETLAPETLVSMNLWGFQKAMCSVIEEEWLKFIEVNKTNISIEFFLPSIVEIALKKNVINIKVIKSSEKWYGLTYLKDKNEVQTQFQTMHKNKIYPAMLFPIQK